MSLTVTGSVMLTTGVTLGLVSGILGIPRGWLVSLLAWGLVAAGLLCGGIMIAASGPAIQTGPSGSPGAIDPSGQRNIQNGYPG